MTTYSAGFTISVLGGLNCAIWYPSTSAEATRTYCLYPEMTGPCAYNGTFAGGTFPAHIFAHGFGGSGIISHPIHAEMARRGRIVIAPDQDDPVYTARITPGLPNGTTADMLAYLNANPWTYAAESGGAGTYGYRPTDFGAMFEAAYLAAGALGIDTSRISIGGHSLGGWASWFSKAWDVRVKAVVSYSMGELAWLQYERYFLPGQFSSLGKPAFFTYGTAEDNLALATHLAGDPGDYIANLPWANYGVSHWDRYYCHDAISWKRSIPHGSHFVYLPKQAAATGGTPDELLYISNMTTQFLDAVRC